MKNILKFGLLTRFVALFLFIFGIHAFTPTVALAAGATIIEYKGGVCLSPNWNGYPEKEYAEYETITFLTPTCDGYIFTGYKYTDNCIHYDKVQSISASNLTLEKGYADAVTSTGCGITAVAQWEPVCINFVLYSANGANNYKEYDVSQWSNDPNTLYYGKNCPDGSDLIDISVFIGYLPNADNSVPPIFYDSAALLECSNEDEHMELTGKCKVLEGDIWRQKTKCADGFSGPNGNNYALAGEACSETVYTIEYYAPDNSLLETKTYSPSTTETLPTQFDTYTVTKWEENPNFGGECGFGSFDPGAPVSNVISGFDGCGGYSIKLIAQWEAVATAPTITLINTGATTALIDSLYYNKNRFYTDARFSREISPSIAMRIPVREYTVRYDAQSGTVSPTSASAQYTFDGYTVTIKGVEYKVINSDGTLDSANKRYLLQAMQQGLPATVKWTGTPSVTLPTPADRSGYTFNGWNTKSDGTGTPYNAGAPYTPTASTKLYAQWEKIQYSVRYSLNGTYETISYDPDNCSGTLLQSLGNYKITKWEEDPAMGECGVEPFDSTTSICNFFEVYFDCVGGTQAYLSAAEICTKVKVCAHNECHDVYQRSNDPSMLYGDDVCSDGSSLPWDVIMGTMPNAKDLPVGFYDASTNTECVNNINDNLQITGDCVVDGDDTWVVKYQCKDGFDGPDGSKYAFAGEACSATAMTVNYICDNETGEITYTQHCDFEEGSCSLQDVCGQVGYNTRYTVTWFEKGEEEIYPGVAPYDNIFNFIDSEPAEVTVTSTSSPITYKLQYVDPDTDEVLKEQNCSYDKECYVTSVTKTGYTALEFECSGDADCDGDTVFKDDDFNGDYINEHSSDGMTVTLYAQWTANTYTVKFDPNGGTGKMEEQKRTYNDDIRLPANTFTRSGYSFRGWGLYAIMDSYSYANNSQANIVIQNTPVANGGEITLYALWDQCQAGMFEKGGKCERCPSNSESTAGATSCTCSDGYNYNGGTTTTTEACVENVYSVDLTYDCGDFADGIAPEKPSMCFSNEPCTMPSADACGVYPGHTFKEWKFEREGGDEITVGPGQNVQSYIEGPENGATWLVVAQWTTDTVYTIEYYCSIDGFSGEVEMSKQCYVGQDDCVSFVDPGCENDDYTYSDLYFETGTRIEDTVRINDGYSLMEILGLMADKGINPNGITTIKVRPNWVAIPRSVTLNNQGADLGNGTEVFYVIDGKVYANSEDTTQTLSKIELPKKTGNSFIGYYEETNCVGDQVVNSNGKIDTAYFADNKGNMVLHACWNPDWREIYYIVNGKQTPTSVQYGAEITIGKGLPTPEDTEEIEVKIDERPGYTFTGWNTKKDGTGEEYKNGAKYIVKHTGVLELYATWEKNEYTIKYYDEETLINTTKYTVDKVGMTLYEPDAKEGYIFSGWYTRPKCTGEHISSINENNLGNYDLYACWTAGKYSLTYELNGGEWPEGSNVTNPFGYTVEDLPMGLAVPAERKGYTFNGWYNNVDCEGTAISKIEEAENITLYAKWDLKKYAIEYIMNGGTNNPENPETYTIKERVVLKDPTYNGNGKLFHKWSGTADCSGGAITGWSGSDAVDKTLYACWKDVIISIKYLCDGTNQIGETQKCSAFAEECTLNANICDGTVKGNYYNFYDIVGFDGSFKKDVDLVMEGFINHLLGDDDFWKADKPTLTLIPVWEPDTYGITLNNGEGVSNATIYSKYGVDKFYKNAQCNQTLPSNKVDIPNKDNYTFAGYSVDANSCENDRVVIDYKGAIDTEYLKKYADETYVSDNPVELYACWRPVSFDVYYNLNDTNNSGTYRNTVVAYNTEVQIGTIINPDDGISETLKPEFVGHEFMGWSTERNGNPDNTYEQGALYTIKGNTTFYAQWKVMTFTCKSGEYLNVKACEQCPKGYKCPQTQFTYNNTVQGRIACSGATEYQDQEGQTTCKTVSDGYYKKDNTAQTECGKDYYCKNAVRTVCPDNGLTSTTTATDVTDCYKNNQSCTVNGGVGMSDVCHYDTTKSGYKNCTDCIINGCSSGYYKDGDACTICPKGSYCANSDKNACPDKYTTTGTGATQQKDCFTTCDDISVEYGIAHADNATVKAPAECTYSRGESVTGNPCDIKDGKCVETSCKYNYEMKGGKCTECVRDNARSFKQGNGNCVVESCEFGYYPYGQSCVPETKECTTSSVYAIAAQKTWDTKTNSYTVCQITECADGYHISDNSCVSDEKTCYVANGSGIQTWNHSLNRWNDECVVTQCNAGYTNDPSLTNETSVHCGRCTNAYDMNGDEAASLYIHGCEIATCKDQGKKYILENNECRTICDSKLDETGSRYWNGKECVHKCNAGYLEW